MRISQEITKRKQTEEALRESEEQFRQLAENIPEVFWLTRYDLQEVIYVNPAYEKIWGRSVTALYKKPDHWMEAIHPDDRQRVQETFVKKVLKGQFDVEYRIVRPDGSIRFIRDRGIPVRNAQGKVYRIAGIAEDITMHKQTQEALQELNVALTHATPGISLLDNAGRYLQVNDAYANMLGYSPEELLGQPWKPTVHSDDYAAAVGAFEAMTATGKGEFEARAVRKDGSIFYKHVVMVNEINNPKGQERYHCFMRDISARKQAEESLQASESRYRTLVEHAPFCIHELDSEGRFLCVNPAGVNMLNLSDEQPLIGRSYLDGVAAEDRGRIKDLLSGAYQGKSSEFEFNMKEAGSAKIIASNFIPLKSPEGGTLNVMGISQDITARKQADEAMRASEQAIRELCDITSVQHRSFEDRIRSLLALGCRRFALPHGMLTRLLDDTLELTFLQSPDEGWMEGTLFPQCQTFCAEALKSDVPLSFEHAGQSEWRHHPAYTTVGLEAYLGTKVVVGQKVYGTLCFASSTPYNRVFTEADKDFLQIMARWIGEELERKQAEETLQESEIRYRALFDDNPSMYFTVAADGTVMAVNQFGAKQLGYSVEELVGQSVFRVFHVDDKLLAQQHFNACLQNPKQLIHWEIRKVRKDGSNLYVKENARMVQNRSGDPVVLIVCEDITERKQAEKDLKQAYDQLREFTRELKELEEKERIQFARELHDEFGQSLTALKLDLAWVSRRLLTMPSCDSRKAIQDKINGMSGLVEQGGHAITRLAASMRPSVLDDLGLVAALEWQAQQCQSHSGIRCEVVVDPQMANKEFPEAQSTTMFRIAQELTTNVMRHSQASDMRISLNEEGKCLVLSVKDNGIGVAKNSIDHPKSFGILGIKERASLVGGECTIIGRVGEGTTATIRVPLALST